MGLAGGWWSVVWVALVAGFLAREFFKFVRREVALTARQKVVRILGGVLLMGIALMIAFSPIALRPVHGMPILARDARSFGYWSLCLAMSFFLLLMAVIDAGEIGRQYQSARKAIRRGAITPEDIDQIRRAFRKDHPDDVGK